MWYCRAAVGDGRVSAPAAFAENGSDCPRDEAGEPLLPTGQAWRKFVLLWIAAMRSLREADQLMEVIRGGDQAGPGSEQQRLLQQLFQQRGQKMPPLQYLLPNMIKHAGVRPSVLENSTVIERKTARCKMIKEKDIHDCLSIEISENEKWPV